MAQQAFLKEEADGRKKKRDEKAQKKH